MHRAPTDTVAPAPATSPPAGSPAAAPAPVLPDYGGACLSTLVPALLGPADGTERTPAGWLPGPVRHARQVVLLVLDGLGWEQLRQRPTVAPTLSRAAGADRPITSVAPTTTACALTSIVTGQPPARTGMLGYRLATAEGEILNALHWTVGTCHPRDARAELPAAQFQPQPAFPGATGPVPVVSRAEFAGTGFTAAHLGQSPLHGYKVASSLLVEVRRLVATGAPFVYAYYDGIDKVAHQQGLGEHYDAELRSVDRLVADLAGDLPPGAAMVVTADHGQVDVGPNVELLGPDVMDGVAFLSGEGRFRWLHARPGAADDVLAAAAERYRGSTWVMGREQLVDEGWFGGPLRDGTAGRVGDVALMPHEPIAFLDPADTGESRLAARHGSLTGAEMLVPLLAFDDGAGG